MRTQRCEACGFSRNDVEDFCCRQCGGGLGSERAADSGGVVAPVAGDVVAVRWGRVAWARAGVVLTAAATLGLAMALVYLAVRGQAPGR
jgi:hypothetical protein